MEKDPTERVETVNGAPAQKKGGRRWYRLLWLLLFIPVIYFGVQVFIVMMPRMRIQVAVQATMTESVTAPGFVALETIPVTAGSGVLYYTVPVGQRVTQDSQVALLFADQSGAAAMDALEEINGELGRLDTAAATRTEGGEADGYQRQMQGGLQSLVGVLQSGRYENLADAAGEVTLAANQFQMVTGTAAGFEERRATLEQQRLEMEARAVPLSTVAAPATGFFTPASERDAKIYDYDTLAAAGPKTMQEMLAQPAGGHDPAVIGHIITDYKWSYFALVSAGEAELFIEGADLELSFPETGAEAIPVEVKGVELDEESGLARVELYCEYMSSAIMQLRTETAEIIFRTEKGIRVDKSALRIIEGERCVYVKFGNQVFKRHIKVILEDDDYLLLSDVYEEGVNEVTLYDEVVVDSGGEELYDKKIL